MSIYLKLTGRTFTIWLVTALINAVLTGTVVTFFEQEYRILLEVFLIVGILSLAFSVPGFFIFWVVLLFKAARHERERVLFRSALTTGFILSAATAACAYGLLSSEVKNYAFLLIIMIILSAVISIMLHFKKFKNLK